MFSRIRESLSRALLLTGEPMILMNEVRLPDLARRARFPAVAEFRDRPKLGSLTTALGLTVPQTVPMRADRVIQ